MARAFPAASLGGFFASASSPASHGFAPLLELDDVGADEPVAEDEALVDRRRRAPDRRRMGVGDSRPDLAVVRSGKKNDLAVERHTGGGGPQA